jgi:8-amino-7-oxononanoate synthase
VLPVNDGGRWSQWFRDRAAGIVAAGQWRAPRRFDAFGPTGALEGRDVVSFASNDYLGLSSHPTVMAAAVDAIGRWGTGATASRLVVGSRPVHHDLERAIAEWRDTGSAIVFPTGYAANVGLLSTLGGRGVRIASDELNHASIIDGCRMARANGAELQAYPHLDLDALDACLAAPGCDRRVVVTDSVFSMDGDGVDLPALLEVCARHDALLVLDEAHAVLEPTPPTDHEVIVVQVGTLSKTTGSLGGFVAGPTALTELLVNLARPYIFTTALSPADAAAALAAIEIIRSSEGDGLRQRLRAHVDRIHPGHRSPIVPVVLGPESHAIAASHRLLERGLFVPAIRPPTVPVGTSRLRIALSAAHTDEQVAALADALGDLRQDGLEEVIG